MVSMGGLSPEWTRASKKDEAVPSCISFGMWVGRTACRSRYGLNIGVVVVEALLRIGRHEGCGESSSLVGFECKRSANALRAVLRGLGSYPL